MIMPLGEIRRIAAFARQHAIKLHCDGARLWEACAAGAGSLPDFCACFDTVSLCFSKGLGAPVGSILVGSADTIRHARWIRKFLGGGLRQPGMLTAAARVAVEETFGRTPDGSDGWLRRSHEVAQEVERLWMGMGGRLVHPVQTNMAWIDVEAAGCSNADFVALCREQGLAVLSGRLVTHYQIAQNREPVLEKLEAVFKKVFEKASSQKGASAEEKMGQSNMYKSE
jgi:threonine aldolase